jgi:Superinfection immunity protein
MAQLSASLIVTWLLYLAIAISVTVMIEAFFYERLLRWGFPTGLRIWTYIIEFAFLSSLATTPLLDKANWPTAVLFHALPVVAVLIYFVPTAIAIERSSQRPEFIFFFNLLTGWTVVGWFWTLAESLGDARRQQAQMIAEHLAPPTPQREPFITSNMFRQEPLRYFVGRGVEQRAEQARPLAGADQPPTPEPMRAQVARRRAGRIFGRPAVGVGRWRARPSSASAAKRPIIDN